MPYLKLNLQIGTGHEQMNWTGHEQMNWTGHEQMNWTGHEQMNLDRSRTNESGQVTTCPYSVTIVTQNLILYLYLCLTQFNNN